MKSSERDRKLEWLDEKPFETQILPVDLFIVMCMYFGGMYVKFTYACSNCRGQKGVSGLLEKRCIFHRTP